MPLLAWRTTVACCLLLAAGLLQQACAAGSKNELPRTLKRSDAKRWQRLKEVAKSRIGISTKRFLQERDTRLSVPLEVDIMMIGLEGDGAYHYRLSPGELDELLSSQYVDRDLCPWVWETASQASVCSSVSTVDLHTNDQSKALLTLETTLRSHMKLVGRQNVYTPPLDGAPHEFSVPLYEIDAALVEDTIHLLLTEAYSADGFGAAHHGHESERPGLEHRLAVVVINPSKQRLNPAVTYEEGQKQWLELDLIEEWNRGQINSSRLHLAEAGFTYRYNYNGKGGGQAWVSSHNFVVLDLSAGPCEFGPLATLGGLVAPSGLPRLEGMMSSLAMEVEDVHQMTLHDHLLHEAVESHHRLLMGELASSIASAIDHLMAPDILSERLEVADTLLLSLVVLQDHDDFNLLDTPELPHPGVELEIDTATVQAAMEALMPRDTACVMMPSEVRLHAMPAILMALSRARMSWSDAVMLDPPYSGLHHTQHSKIDSKLLMQELKQFIPAFTGDTWAEEVLSRRPNASLASSVFHDGLRHLPVIVLSLKSAPPGIMFDNGELVAADHDMVVVLQLVQAKGGIVPDKPHLLPKPESVSAESAEATEKLRLYSGHHQEGHPLALDGATGVTAHIIAGMAMALGGVTPPWEKMDPDDPKKRMQDWRWAVGCVPWGPYANCTTVSGLIQAAARRNQVISHIEMALRMVQTRLDDMDKLVAEVYEGPWMEFIGEVVPHDMNDTRLAHDRPRHWLDVLASRSHAYNGSTLNTAMVVNLENELAGVEAHVNSLSWVLFSQTWDTAKESVVGLLQATDDFVALADKDIHMCRQVAECCSVRHGHPQILDMFVTVLFIFMLLLFAAIVFIAIASQKTWKPPKAAPISPVPSVYPPGRTGSGSGLMAWGSGNQSPPTSRQGSILPTWGSQSGSQGGILPR